MLFLTQLLYICLRSAWLNFKAKELAHPMIAWCARKHPPSANLIILIQRDAAFLAPLSLSASVAFGLHKSLLLLHING